MKRTHITLQDLIDNDACDDQRELFAATFGESVKIGLRNGFKALKAGLDVLWCERFITAPALAEYEKVTDAARAEYEKSMPPNLVHAMTAEASA